MEVSLRAKNEPPPIGDPFIIVNPTWEQQQEVYSVIELVQYDTNP